MAAPPEGKPPSSFLLRHTGRPRSEFTALPPRERASVARAAVADLHFFLDDGRSPEDRNAPPRTLALARSLGAALRAEREYDARASRELDQRLITDGVLRAEHDRDQNVYLSALFTRRMTRALPDLVFQPEGGEEVSRALAWARREGVPVTLRGAGTTAMGGAVPAEGGLVLDLSRLDAIEVDALTRRVRFGAGARMRPLHRELRARDLALPVYPSNLGGTYAGWLATGGIGMNAYGRGRALDHVLAAEVVLPGGEWLRLGADHSLAVLLPDGPRELAADGREAWFRERGYPIFGLADFAGSEGQFGVLTCLEVAAEPLPDLAPFLLAFPRREEALLAFTYFEERIGADIHAPADIKLLSASHVRHARDVWREEDAKTWRAAPSSLSGDRELPWRAVVSPAELGVAPADLGAPSPGDGAYLFVDFLSRAEGREFARLVPRLPGSPRVLAEESVRFALDRFRPQQSKRLGPALLAAEIVLPSKLVDTFVPAAEALARRAGRELDAEVYFLSDRIAMCIAGYLADHRSGSFRWDLVLAPQLLDLAIRGFGGEPYVLGRWQAPYFPRKFAPAQRRYLASLKAALDPHRFVNRGAFFDPGLRGVLGALLGRTMVPAVRVLRWLTTAAPPASRALRALFSAAPGPAAGRGFAAHERPPRPEFDAETATGSAIACVNCGECNTVCPIFHESRLRLPQMLTHLGEALHAGDPVSRSGTALLDLCMRCGNCEEVCQAGIPHLPLYGALQAASDAARPYDAERHILLLERLRSSERYALRFLGVRPGGYVARAPASLPGEARYVLMRAENDEGPSATCIHCAACVDVCPTNANREYEGADPRWITTVQESCIGCGTCVEVCPANLTNGGRTLRVMEAPTLDWLAAASEFAARESAGAAREAPRPG